MITTFDTCSIFVSLCDLQNLLPTIDPANPPKLYVSNDRGFLQLTNTVYPLSQSVSFNASGEAIIEVIETESTGEKLEFHVTMPNGDSIESYTFPPSIVPNVPFANLSDIVTGNAKTSGFDMACGSQPLSSGIKEDDVVFTDPLGISGIYGIKTNLINLTDPTPLIQPVNVKTKPATGFTGKWSSMTDSGNYLLDYLAIINDTTLTDVLSECVDVSIGSKAVAITIPEMEDAEYTVTPMLINFDDEFPVIVPVLVSDKTTTSFTAIWSSATDSDNYKLCYVVRDSCSPQIFQGKKWENGSRDVGSGVKTLAITFDKDIETTNYALLVNLTNLIDGSPLIMPVTPVTKTSTGCSVIWSSNTDSANYKIDFIAVTI